MNKKILIALCGTVSIASAANADCTETDTSACLATECCGVLEEEGFNFLEALEEYWGAHHEHVHICHDKTATTYTDANSKQWAFACDDIGASYKFFAAGAVATSALFSLF